MIPLPNIATFIGYLTQDSSTWLTALLPLVGMLIGISAVFLIGTGILKKIENWLYPEKDEMEEYYKKLQKELEK